jgi:RNA polymerase sigma factor (sigma-70 family)
MSDLSYDVLQRNADVGAVYEEHYDLLVGIAVGRFRISAMDAETLAHDVFLSFLKSTERVIDRERWLVGAICNASRHHLRQAYRTEPLDDTAADAPDPRAGHHADAILDQLAAREVYGCLTPKCQEALRLRYLEGYTVPEVAVALGTTKKYAQKLISRCLEQAQRRSKLPERA